jgi:AcrR family transcriptional regulator
MNKFSPEQLSILNAAIDEFQDHGYKGGSMTGIAQRSGFKKKIIVQHFENKQMLFKDVFIELYSRIAPQLQDIIDGDMPIFEKIRHFTNNYVGFINDYPFLPLGLMRKLDSNTDFAHEFIINLRRPDPTKFYNQIEKEIAKEKIRPINPKQLMVNIFALSVYPHVASPLVKDFIRAENQEFEDMKEKGKSEVADFVINSIKM